MNLTHPLRLETLKSYIEFEDITEETISVFKYICSKLKPRFFVNNNFGFNYVCRVATEVVDKLINDAHLKLSLSEGDSIEVIRNKIKNLF